MATKRLRPLPKFLDSQLGPVPVVIVDKIETGADEKFVYGRFHTTRRVIEIAADMSLTMQWQTLFHEWAHMVLMDSGLRNGMTDMFEEQLCDAIGTARVVEIMTGKKGR